MGLLQPWLLASELMFASERTPHWRSAEVSGRLDRMIFRPDTFIAWWMLRSIRIPRRALLVFTAAMVGCCASIVYRALVELPRYHHQSF